MRRRASSRGLARAVPAVVLALTAGGPAAALPAEPDGAAATEEIVRAVTTEQLEGHLRAFQEAADAHGGNRAAGTAGYRASVDHVVERLRAAGYRPRIQTFRIPYYEELPGTTVAVEGEDGPRAVLTETEATLLPFSGSGDVSAPVRVVDTDGTEDSDSSGCEAEDFEDFEAGSVALVQRGGCSVTEKAVNADRAGAAAVLIANSPGRDGVVRRSLEGPGATDLPVVGLDGATGRDLLGGGEVTVRARTVSERRETYNVLADTPTGDPGSTVVVGAHLDSVPEGPGLNDNGSGAAGVLAVAEALAGTETQNRVRFAWWGAEELNLNGADHYVSDLRANDPGAFDDIALYLNFDMIGSPNYGRFVYDGDTSGGDWHDDSADTPAGSDAIEAAFEGYFESAAIAADEVPLDDGSDHLVFAETGIPVGGLFTGDVGEKSRREAARYGGEAGMAYDPCYHAACDDLDNVDRQVLEEMSDAMAAVVLGFASSTIDDGAPLDPPDGWPRRGVLEELGPVLTGLAAGAVLAAVTIAAALAVRRRARGRR